MVENFSGLQPGSLRVVNMDRCKFNFAALITKTICNSQKHSTDDGYNRTKGLRR
jgi:hypothetical protein